MKIFCALLWTATVAVTVERCWAEFLLVEVDDAAGIGARSSNAARALEIEELGRQGICEIKPCCCDECYPCSDERIAEARTLAEAKNLKKIHLNASSSSLKIHPEKDMPDEPYTKLDDKECWTKKYKQFSTVQLAKDACSADSNCKGVYDHECDAGAKDIYLCPISVLGTAYYSPVNSCVYQKNEPEWSDWSECSESCGSGFQVRTRKLFCKVKKNCKDEEKETRQCQIRNNQCEEV